MSNDQQTNEEPTPQERKLRAVTPVPQELPSIPAHLPPPASPGLLRGQLNAITHIAPVQSPEFSLERGDTGMLLAQLDALPDVPMAPKLALERRDTGMLLSALESLSNPPIPLPEFVLERGDTGMLLAQLGVLSNSPVPLEELTSERGDTGMLLSQLSLLSNSPVPLAEFASQRWETGMALSQVSAFSNLPPAELMTLAREPSLLTPEALAMRSRSFAPESSIFHPKEPAPIVYISNIDREFDTQKWVMVVVIGMITLLLGCGVFVQLRSTNGLNQQPNVPPHPSKSQ